MNIQFVDSFGELAGAGDYMDFVSAFVALTICDAHIGTLAGFLQKHLVLHIHSCSRRSAPPI
jgi:hypothetical protein